MTDLSITLSRRFDRSVADRDYSETAVARSSRARPGSIFQSPLPVAVSIEERGGSETARAKRDPGDPRANEGFGNAALVSAAARRGKRRDAMREEDGTWGRVQRGGEGRGEGRGIRGAKPDGTPGISR